MDIIIHTDCVRLFKHTDIQKSFSLLKQQIEINFMLSEKMWTTDKEIILIEPGHRKAPTNAYSIQDYL